MPNKNLQESPEERNETQNSLVFIYLFINRNNSFRRFISFRLCFNFFKAKNDLRSNKKLKSREKNSTKLVWASRSVDTLLVLKAIVELGNEKKVLYHRQQTNRLV